MNILAKLRLLFVLILLLGGSPLAMGTDGAADGKPVDNPAMGGMPAGTPDADVLLAHLLELQQQASSYRSDLKNAEGEAQQAIFLQLISEEELRANMDELLAVIQEQGPGDLAVKFKSIVARQTETIHQDIKTASLELDKLNDLDQQELSAEEVEELTRTVSAFNAYLDVIHVAAYENMERKKALGLDYADNMEELKTLSSARCAHVPDTS